MATITVKMNEQDAELVRRFASFEGVSISDFARNAILEKIEDSYDLQELRDAMAQDCGGRFSVEDVLSELSSRDADGCLVTSVAFRVPSGARQMSEDQANR